MTSSPGQATIAQKRKITATVEAIDVAKREITLKGPKGKVVPLSVSPDVRNLEQVKVGDQLVVDLRRGPVAHAQEGRQGDAPPATPRPTPCARPTGAKPGGAVAEQIKVTADVIAVDQKTHMVTLRGPKQEVDLHVADPGAAEADQGRRPDRSRVHAGARHHRGAGEEVAPAGGPPAGPFRSRSTGSRASRAMPCRTRISLQSGQIDSAPCTWQ